MLPSSGILNDDVSRGKENVRTKNAPEFRSDAFSSIKQRHSSASKNYPFLNLRTGVPSSRQMPKPVSAHKMENTGTNQLRKA